MLAYRGVEYCWYCFTCKKLVLKVSSMKAFMRDRVTNIKVFRRARNPHEILTIVKRKKSMHLDYFKKQKNCRVTNLVITLCAKHSVFKRTTLRLFNYKRTKEKSVMIHRDADKKQLRSLPENNACPLSDNESEG
ncbi:hypothetical protein V1477_006167 [Vespula maculifrons]|uniref:Uncharacterized protein n=1 Tax=Vespula maculifrons TaxID=7453 RepID=A0ABD2CKH5_VESMC